MKMKLLVPILALLIFAVFYGCQSGIQSGSCCGQGGGQQAYFFNIEKSISDFGGQYVGIDGFGTEFFARGGPGAPPAKTSTTVTDNGALLIAPGGWITIDIPEQFRGEGYLLEFHILVDFNENYDNSQARFELTDDQDNVIAAGEIEDDGVLINQTFTLQADLTEFAGTTNVTLWNMWPPPGDSPDRAQQILGHTLEINNYASVIPIETGNDSNIFITDIRDNSSRINSINSLWMEDWDTKSWSDGKMVSTPDGFWGDDTSCCDGSFDFDLSDIVSTMTQPVVEFNYGRSSHDSDASEVYLYGDSDQIIYIRSDYQDAEDMGHTAIIDITEWQNSTSFRFNIENFSWLNPFVKVFDAAANSSAVLLDVTPPPTAGREYVSHSGKFLFYQDTSSYLAGGLMTDNLQYDAPHWIADPTHDLPYGIEGRLTFSIPSAVSSFGHPVLEIMHFTPDSDTQTADPCFGETASPGQGPFGNFFNGIPGCPDYYPIEFFLMAGDDEIAHVFFDESPTQAGGMLKNQIPIEEFKNSTTMSIIVPGVDNDRWSQMAFPPFIKIFDSIN